MARACAGRPLRPWAGSAILKAPFTIRRYSFSLNRHAFANKTRASVSGGEPFQQPEAFERLLAEVRARTALSVLVFSGYRLDEILAMERGPAILGHIDVLIAGRYVPARALGEGLLGSANQTVHFLTDRHGMADIGEVPQAEIQIDALGRVAVTGVAPPNLGGDAA